MYLCDDDDDVFVCLCVCVCVTVVLFWNIFFFFGHFFYAPFSLIFIKCHQMLRSPNTINNLDIFLIFDTKKLDDDDDDISL